MAPGQLRRTIEPMVARMSLNRPVRVAVVLLMLATGTAGAQTLDVVINEIAWMGSTTSANSEWSLPLPP